MSEFTDRFTDVVAPVISFDNGVEMAEARGAWLTDAAGKRYLDFGTGISVTNCGHNHPRIVAAAHEQLDRVWHGGGTFRYDSYVSAAEQLVSVAPEPIDMFFFMNSGAEAVECKHPIRDFHVTLLHLLGLDDNKLTYFHGGRFKQLSQFGGKVIEDLLG